MLWQNTVYPQAPNTAAPVPEEEGIRLAALQAAWRRDRWVARKRIWLRWSVWGAQRYVAPAIGVVGLWLAVRATMSWLDDTSLTESVATRNQPPLIKVGSQAVPRSKPAVDAAQAELSPIIPEHASMLRLKLEPALLTSDRISATAPSKISSKTVEDPILKLISENWLHSKEP